MKSHGFQSQPRGSEGSDTLDTTTESRKRMGNSFCRTNQEVGIKAKEVLKRPFRVEADVDELARVARVVIQGITIARDLYPQVYMPMSGRQQK